MLRISETRYIMSLAFFNVPSLGPISPYNNGISYKTDATHVVTNVIAKVFPFSGLILRRKT